MLGLIDMMRAEDPAVELIIRVLSEQGAKIASPTYRSDRRDTVASSAIAEALVQEVVRSAACPSSNETDETSRAGPWGP